MDSRVKRKAFGPKRDERRVEKITRSEAPHLNSSTNIIREIKSRRRRWVGYIACKRERKGAYRFLLGNSKGKENIWKT